MEGKSKNTEGAWDVSDIIRPISQAAICQDSSLEKLKFTVWLNSLLYFVLLAFKNTIYVCNSSQLGNHQPLGYSEKICENIFDFYMRRRGAPRMPEIG